MNTKLDRTDYIILIIFYTISAFLNVFDYRDQNATLIEYFIDIPMFVITSYLGLLVFMYYIVPNYLVKQKRYILFAVFGVLTVAMIGIIERVTGFATGGNDWSKFPVIENLLLYSVFNGADSVGLPLAILVTKKFYESQKQISNIEKKQKENELKLLRSQINPHFLFNNLNTLDSLIDTDSEKAKEYINRLSLTYRYLIQTKDSEVMELSEEMQHAENYIFLIKTRFGNDYEFIVEKKASLENKFIPTGAIQALLENVVKHNKATHNQSVKTKITLEEKWLSVHNTKSTTPKPNESLGTGLDNLKSRYSLLSDKKVTIKDAEHAFEVIIPIVFLSE
jgi:sensor histidine kinase YesM